MVDTLENLWLILLSLGAFQGLIFGVILWNSKGINKIAHRFLAALLFFFSYRLVREILYLFDLGFQDSWTYYILIDYDWIYGALLYFFVCSYVHPKFKLEGKHWIHFLPVFIEIVWSSYIKSQNLYWDGTRESLSWLGYWGYAVWNHYPTKYVIAGTLIFLYSAKAKAILRRPPAVAGYQLITDHLKWIKRVILVLVIFSFIFTLTVLVQFFFFDFAFNFFGYPIFIILAAITYWIGLEGFSRRKLSPFKITAVPSEKEQQQLLEIADRIDRKMREEKLFKNPNLNLASLADAVGEKSYLVSKALTMIKQKKFTDYVNELRFQELQELLSEPKNEQFTLLGLAYDAGFNSKASFHRTVKRLTGQSPKHLKA